MRAVYEDDVIKMLNEGWIKGIYPSTANVRNLPTAEPERPKGKWVSHYDYCKKHGYIPSGVIALWWCDQCEQGVEHPTNFCPNCGVNMKGEDNETD